MIIALTGTSGSGKTTLINHLKEWSFLREKKAVVKKEDDFLTFKVLKFFFGDKLFSNYKEEKFFRKKNTPFISKIFSGLVYWLYPLVVYLELLWLHVVYSVIFRNHILLSDRYVYDYIVTFKNVLNIYNPIAKLLLNNFPRPSLTFYLKISKKTAINRNKNNIKKKITASPSHQENVVKEYNKLAEKHGLLTVNGKFDFKEIKEEVEKCILAKTKLSNIKTISISGIDGAGKTTVCNNLNALSKKVGISSKVVHFYHVSILYKLLDGKVGFSNKTTGTHKNKSFVWALLTFVDSYIQYFYFVNKYRGQLVIFDRYFYDYLVSFKYRNVPNSGFFEKLIIKPDKAYVLLQDPDVAQARTKDNLSSEYFSNIYGLYLEIAGDEKLDTILVDEKSAVEVVDEIIYAAK